MDKLEIVVQEEARTFYSSKKNTTDRSVDLFPENKPLGKAPTKSDFRFTTIDLTSNERNIWEQSILVGNDLKEDFVKEKNLELYKGRIAEASKNMNGKKED